MKKTVVKVLFIIYVFFVFITTFILMKYNNFSVIEIKDMIIFSSNKTIIKDLKKGDLMVLKKQNNYKNNDEVFYYTVYDPEVKVNKGKISNIETITEKERTITIDGENISSEYVIGKSSKIIPFLGYFMLLFTSTYGYLFCIILPMIIIFFFNIHSIFRELKGKKVKNEENK